MAFTTEGMNYLWNVGVHGATQVATWYIVPYVNNYTPTIADTAANFPADAGEAIAQYVEGSRPTYVEAAASGGATSNVGNEGVITAASGVTFTIYGIGLSSVSTKGATTGILLQAGKFPVAKTLSPGEKLELSIAQVAANA